MTDRSPPGASGPAERRLARRFLAGQTLLTPVMRALMRATGAAVDRAIDQALAEIGAFCGADRSYVFRFGRGGRLVSNTHEWCAPGIAPQIARLQNLPRSIVDPWMPCLRNDRVLVVDEVAAMPAGDPLRLILEGQDIRGLIAVPMTDGDALTGFVGFDIVRERGPFDIIEIGLLQNVGDGIGTALARRDAAEAARTARRRARSAEREVHRLARVTEVTTNLIVILDPAQRILWANRAFEDQTGHRLADIAGRDFGALVRGPGSDPAVDAAVRQAVAARGSYEGETVNYDAAGRPYWIQFNIHPLFDPDGSYAGHVSVETVISERKALEQEIAARSAFQSAIMRTSVSGIVAMQAAGRVAYANDAAQAMLGLRPDPAAPGGWRWPDPVAGETGEGDGAAEGDGAMDPADLPAAIAGLHRADAGPLRVALRLPGGGRRVLSLTAAPLEPALNGADVVLSVADITAQEAAAARLRRLADEDPLTGLQNRRGLAAAIDAALSAPGGGAPPPFALLMIDIDNFKVVNDTLRHDAGDAVLREVARRLRAAAGAGDCVARIGGDEFVVLARGLGADAAAARAETLRAVLARPIRVGGRPVGLTASVGAALCPAHGRDRPTLMTGADMALDAAKRAGRNRAVILSDALHAAEARRSAILGALAGDGLAEGLTLVFQPQVRASLPREIVGAEVLLRWTDPRIGAVGAADFVPLAEAAGLIGRIDAHVLDRAVAQLARWGAQGWTLPLSVNVSARTFAGAGFAAAVLDRLAAARVDPRRLVLELTETAPVPLTPVTEANIRRLRGAGVGLAIDDFGTGYASLCYLQRIAATALKIDRGFVAPLGGPAGGAGAAIVRAMISVARAMDLTITAEGVETEAQRDWLVREGCDHLQGFLTGAPVTAPAFEQAHMAHLRQGRARGGA